MSELITSHQIDDIDANQELHNANIFDIMRHLAALAVLFSHHFAFYGLSEPLVFGVTKLGTFAVIVFFTISGYLITQSYERTSTIFKYFEKRIYRIFPALILCSLIMTTLVCTLFGKGDGIKYLLSFSSLYNFFHFSTLGAYATPEQMNFFSSTYIHKNALNGSLWTLFFEFFDYILIFIFINNKKYSFAKLFILLVGSVFIQFLVQKGITNNYFIDRSTILTIPFALGGLLFLTRKKLYKQKISYFILMLAFIGVFLSKGNDERSMLFFGSISLIVIILGSSFKDRFICGRFDFSYGIYIYAYPTQQIIINETGLSFWLSMLVSIIIVLMLSSFSWFFVERKFLKRKIVKN
jgi:peptidoglycan/LPS O-acetylase OafA/YrhL